MKNVVRAAEFYFESALGKDENQQGDDALPLYKQAAEFYLTAVKLAGELETPQGEQDSRQYRKQLLAILSRAEELSLPSSSAPATDGTDGRPASTNPSLPSVPTSKRPGAKRCAPPSSKLTNPEIEILKRSSRINGKIFQPWIGSYDEKNERYTFPEPFLDPNGRLKLSKSQKEHFHAWRRPSQFCSKPVMISKISPYCIQQSVIEDCSFVSSLCITASYERRFHKKLITKIIFPQNREGLPVYNPCGKYMVKLWHNGVARKVIVDDQFPVDRHGNLLCSTSSNSNELWVSIIEKAYMKLNGGYEFGGSNSGIDLFALTGWIPESFHINKPEFAKQRTWERLVSAHKYGDCLITVATGETLTEAEAKRVGLVTGHAYAVLDAREVLGTKMLLVKNPWAHVQWKGPYSPGDKTNWTPAMRKALSYDQVGHMQMDNGIFWIDYGSLLKYYSTIFLNWNRGLFRRTSTVHGHWPKAQGPKNDQYSLAYNPQYSLTVSVPETDKKSRSLWVLISRHTVNRHDVFEKEFVTLHVYNNQRPLQRVFYPSGCFLRGQYSNNPHFLVRLDVPPGESAKTYTLVVSQYEKVRDISFTIDVFSTANFKIRPIPLSLGKYERKMRGEWKHSRPVVKVMELLVATKVRLQLQGAKDMNANIEVRNQKTGKRFSSVNYRQYSCLESEGEIPAGTYDVVLSSWEHANGPFIFTLGAKDEGVKIDGISM